MGVGEVGGPVGLAPASGGPVGLAPASGGPVGLAPASGGPVGLAPASGGPPVIIFDRDGTIIDVVRDEETGAVVTAFHPSHIRLLAGAVEGMRALEGAGFALAIATNQPGPAKGQCTAAAVARTNVALLEQLEREGVTIASLQVCMHHPDGGPGGDPALVYACDCRKPKAGLLEGILRDTKADRAGSWMIGDARSDVLAARAAGLRAALVFAIDRCELCPLRSGPHDAPSAVAPDVHGPTLHAIAKQILAANPPPPSRRGLL